MSERESHDPLPPLLGAKPREEGEGGGRGGDQTPLLEVRDVSVRFGGLQALDSVSFDVRAGEILALIGPNGAGKSTLLNIVSGALPGQSGEVRFRGERIDGLPAERINRLGICRTFQAAEILRDMTVRENVMVAGAVRTDATWLDGFLGLARSRKSIERLASAATGALETVGLGTLADQSAAILSAGQQRLLAVARALATDAPLLLLDEPGAGLNAREKAELAAIIERIRASGRTIVFVEHDLGLVGKLAERIVVLDHGRRIAIGTPDMVRRDPKVIEAYLGNTAIRTAAATATQSNTRLLEVDRLGVRYGELTALADVTLDVGVGEIVAIVGANGAGKSTLLKAIAGALPAAGGSIRLAGDAIDARTGAARVAAGISLAPEGRQLFASLSVRDNLLVGRYARLRAAGLRNLLAAGATARAETQRTLEEVFTLFPRLRERADQPAGTLSGGEGQMLAIARALVNRPRLLMLDEPSFGLAPQVAREILEALPRLAAGGVAILLVEQNARAALQVSARGFVLVNGRIAASGASATLLADSEIADKYLGWDGGTLPAAA